MPRTIKRTESELIQHIGGIAADTRRLLDDSHYESTFQLRTRDSAIGRELTVGVVRADSCTDLDQLIQVAQPRCGVALVVLGEAAGTTATLNLDNDGSARLEPLGLSVKPVRLSAATGLAIDQLVAPPPAPDGDRADDQPEYTDDVTAEIGDGQLSHANHQVEESDCDEDEDWVPPCPEVLVRVLGTPTIDQYPKLGRSELNIVTFLACAGGQATEDQVIDAVWSGQLRERKTLWNKLSIARAVLGRHLPPRDQSSGIVSLHPAVMTDLQLLKALVDRASLVSSYEAIGLLSDALELVRGVPFDAVGTIK